MLAASYNTMTESLQRTMSELSRRSALAAIGEFATSLAHEVRNALTSVRVDLQRAAEKLQPGSQQRDLVDRSLFGVNKLDETVTAALRIARSGNVAFMEMDVVDVLKRVAARAEPAYHQRGASLALNADEPVLISGDANALEQLFFNLVMNAVQALHDGGSTRIDAIASGDEAIVRVVDDGAGIRGEHINRVLEPFFTTRETGTGLGLPMARQIAIAHSGDLSIASEYGAGTTVEVRVPLL